MKRSQVFSEVSMRRSPSLQNSFNVLWQMFEKGTLYNAFNILEIFSGVFKLCEGS